MPSREGCKNLFSKLHSRTFFLPRHLWLRSQVVERNRDEWMDGWIMRDPISLVELSLLDFCGFPFLFFFFSSEKTYFSPDFLSIEKILAVSNVTCSLHAPSIRSCLFTVRSDCGAFEISPPKRVSGLTHEANSLPTITKTHSSTSPSKNLPKKQIRNLTKINHTPREKSKSKPKKKKFS